MPRGADANDRLERYLAATRRSLDVRVQLPFYRDTLLNALAHLCELEHLELTPHIVYSSRRHSELVVIGGRPFLIHDRYLGQTLNLLNRLLIEEHPPDHATVYSHKLMAEFFRNRSWAEGALVCAFLYKRRKDSLQSTKVNDPLRGLFAVAQELFAIAHEAYHLVLRTNHRLREDVRQTICNYMASRAVSDSFGGHSSRQEIRDRIALEPLSFHLLNPSPEELDAATNEYLDWQATNRSRELVARLANNPRLEEELMCDHLAAFYTAAMLRRHGVDLVLQAVYIAHFHLRWLKHLDFGLTNYHNRRLGSALPPSPLEVDEHYADLQIRSHYMLRRCCGVSAELEVMGLHVDGDVGRTRLRHTLLNWQRLYYLHLYDPMAGTVEGALNRDVLGREVQRWFAEEEHFKELWRTLTDPGDATGALRLVDILTGWVATPDATETLPADSRI